MAKHETSERAKASSADNEDNIGLNELSPWEQDKKVLQEKLEELDKYQHSLPEHEQKLRETIWREGRDQILVQLASIQRKEQDGGFSGSVEIPGADVPPVKPQTPIAEKPVNAPNKPVEPEHNSKHQTRHG